MEVDNVIVQSAKKLIQTCLGIGEGEKLLIVSDEKKVDVAYPFACAGRELGIDTTYIEAQSQTKGDVPLITAEAMSKADALLAITSMSYSHTAARKNATQAGVRIGTMPLLTKEIATKYLDADYDDIYNRSCFIANVLTNSSSAHFTTPYGSDVVLNIKDRIAMADSGRLVSPGAFGNLPAGEGLIAPIEDGVNGVLVMQPGDCISYIGYVLDETVLEIKDGRIVSIKGNKTAEAFKAMISDKDDEAVGIAELGIGTNSTAKIIGHPLLDEKVIGTVHLGFGSNSTFGGVRTSNIHYDCIVNDVTLSIDNIVYIENGKHIYQY